MDDKELIQMFVCKKCKKVKSCSVTDIHYDESGYGYSTKYIKCPDCGEYCVVGYVEDEGLFVNDDLRYYI